VDERKTDMSATPSDERREYRPGTRTFVLLLVPSSVLLLLGVCFGVPGWLAHDIALRNFGLFFMIMWLGLTAYLAFLAWNARLTLAPDGIEVRGAVGIGPVLIRWDNIARLRVKPRHQGLVLLAPMKTPAADRLWDNARIYSTYDREEIGLIAQRRYVPLADYSPRFRQGDLQHEILRRAPWLAGDVEGQEEALRAGPTPGAPAGITRRQWAVFIGLMVPAIALGIFLSVSPPVPRHRAMAAIVFLSWLGGAFIVTTSALVRWRAKKRLLACIMAVQALFLFLVALDSLFNLLRAFGIHRA
jgi:hypothetical protein